MDYLSSLNPKQLQAVKQTEGPLLVLAGAGSGKTRVITVRIAYLIAEKKVPPHNILAVTFTNKAAGEMRERVTNLLRGERLPSAPLISTFHSLCVRILRQDIEAFGEGFTRSFTIYDTDDSTKVLKNCIKDLGLDPKLIPPRQVLHSISGSKNRGEDYEIYASKVETNDEKKAAFARVYKAYINWLNKANALDFDDLLIKTVRLLRKSPEVRAKYNDRFKYILIDEYQDTNPLQFALVKFLTEKQENICVVGDDAQSIYGFRQADIRNILEFEIHFPNAKTVLLEQNYRSTQNILDAADAVISNNINRKEKKLWTENPDGEKLFYFQALDADNEGRFVASKIYDHQRINPKERQAVLYRTNAQSRIFEESFRRMRISYNIVGGFSFYERAEIRDVIAYLKFALNTSDDIAFGRIVNSPTRGIGKTSLDKLSAFAKELDLSLWEALEKLLDRGAFQAQILNARAMNAFKLFSEIIRGLRKTIEQSSDSKKPVSEVVIAAIENTGYSSALKTENSDEAHGRLENLEELVNAAVEYDEDADLELRDFIDHATLSSDMDNYDNKARVTLMTVHAAKGLEFPVVFLVGLEDGIFPHARSINNPKELEEERRLAYVALTRAEKTLYITHATRRRVYGEEMAAEPSQFLNELPYELIDDISHGNSWLAFANAGKASKSTATMSFSSDPVETKPRAKFTGKTYNNADAIAEFFENKRRKPAETGTEQPAPKSGFAALKEDASKFQEPPAAAQNGKFLPGSHVRHSKYGKGLVLRREGSGDKTKLTVSFPGFGQKKLMEKFAKLEGA